MTEEDRGIEHSQIAVDRFREILGDLRSPGAKDLMGLINNGLIRITTDQETLDTIRGSRKSSDTGITALFNPHSETTTALIAVDINAFVSKGPYRLKDQIRNIVNFFSDVIVKTHTKYGYNWAYLEDSEVAKFISEIQSGGGSGYDIIDATGYERPSRPPI